MRASIGRKLIHSLRLLKVFHWDVQSMLNSPQPQCYQLQILLKQDARIEVGRLGVFDFPAGRYVYTGSAKKNIGARISRHLSLEKKLRWHIDYLLQHPATSIIVVELFTATECEVNKRTRGTSVAFRFGASDCKAACGSHLKYRGSN